MEKPIIFWNDETLFIREVYDRINTVDLMADLVHLLLDVGIKEFERLAYKIIKGINN